MGSIPRLIKELISKLEVCPSLYCIWKNNNDLSDFFAGKDDLDILVRSSKKSLFEEILKSLGFVEAENRFIKFHGVKHYYGYDCESDKIYHLHVYYEIITGESHTKNYHLPFEKLLLENTRTENDGLRRPGFEEQLLIYLIRYYIKISCVPGFLLMRKNRRAYSSELNYLLDKSDSSRLLDLVENNCPYLENIFILKMYNMISSQNLMQKIYIGLLLRHKITTYRRYSFMEGFCNRYWQVLYRAINKTILKQKKSLVKPGLIVAITGLDGSGKSTTVKKLHDLFKHDFNCHYIHVGKPPGNIFTFPARLPLQIKRIFRSLRTRNGILRSSATNKIEFSVSGTRGYLFALRKIVLAFDRYSLLKKAKRVKMKGHLILCDRYPTKSFGKMDSPGILYVDGDSWLMKKIGVLERRLYDSLPVPDLIFELKVPLEEAIKRNETRVKSDKETEYELRERYRHNQDIEYNAGEFYEVDGNKTIEKVTADIRGKIWNMLQRKQLGVLNEKKVYQPSPNKV